MNITDEERLGYKHDTHVKETTKEYHGVNNCKRNKGRFGFN